MFKLQIAVLPILWLCPQIASAITFISLSDPSLQGTTLASNQVNVLPEDLLPSSQPIAAIEQKVVRNAAGTLDFYYRLEAIDDHPILLDSIVDVGAFGYKDTPITSKDFQIFVEAAIDGPGDVTPFEGSGMRAGNPSAPLYVMFLFGGNPLPPDYLPVQWTLTATGTNFLIVRTDATDFAPIGSALIDTIDAVSSDRTYYSADGVFAPIPVPEPASCTLLLVGFSILTLRPRRR